MGETRESREFVAQGKKIRVFVFWFLFFFFFTTQREEKSDSNKSNTGMR